MKPISVARTLEEDYRRYLQASFYFRDSTLRASFAEELASGTLTNGPYLEGTPVYKRGEPPAQLFPELLGSSVEANFLEALQGNRPMYTHQAEALRQVEAGNNVLVSTGTGSGKTEAYLYPILLQLYREHTQGTLGNGVRALILYPMNALANDQRERLGTIAQKLEQSRSPFRFTFGQYIGETPEDESDQRRNAQDHLHHRLPGELVLRSEIRQRPPHILLTNFSMLEFLLLRPADSPIFDGGNAANWSFLVLDEAHQYVGSKGIEIGMLLRRLKQRLGDGGCSGPLRCLATSATLFSGKQQIPAAVRFATNLFGEPFTEASIVMGEHEHVQSPGTGDLSASFYASLSEALNLPPEECAARFASAFAALGLQPSGETPAERLGVLLEYDRRSHRLRERLLAGPALASTLAEVVFPELEMKPATAALEQLVELLMLGTRPGTDASLLSARYHVLLRSLEGAYISYHPSPKVLLARKPQEDEALFEAALCHECGQHYLVGKIRNGAFSEAARDPSSMDFEVSFYRPLDEPPSDTTQNGRVHVVCARCGSTALYQGPASKPACDHDYPLYLEQQSPGAQDDRVPRCGACGYRSFDPVRELVFGSQGPTAVLATTLSHAMPESGRKLLTFSDSRQEAAFFAWYLEDSNTALEERSTLLAALDRLTQLVPEGGTVRELVPIVRDVLLERKLLPESSGAAERLRAAWLRVYREFLTEQHRISLEGVGCARWSVKRPDRIPLPQHLASPPWNLEASEIESLFYILLNTLRVNGAVELDLDAGVSLMWDDLKRSGSQTTCRVGPPAGDPTVESWDSPSASRGEFLTRLLVRRGLGNQEAAEQAVSLLREWWDLIQDADDRVTNDERLLVRVTGGTRLNPRWWRFTRLGDEDVLFGCDTCGRTTHANVAGVCPRYRCPGTLHPLEEAAERQSHYRQRYEAQSLGKLRVEEHTAQLDRDRARQYQREFRDGHIHVLSCSTTFELGVDLGDLDTILLRNVPPQAFNYTQRVGRAGRRPGHCGFAVTYCRRVPHDLYHFIHPEEMLFGKVRTPAVNFCNEKIITRHIAATALAAFFRQATERFGTVEDLLQNMDLPMFRKDFISFLKAQETMLTESLRTIVPTEMSEATGIEDGSWLKHIAGQDSRIASSEEEASADFKNVRDIREDAHIHNRNWLHGWAGARMQTITSEDVLSFLSRKAIIPKYGFPVDVVELDTQKTFGGQDSTVALQRDLTLAIAEFAPTSKIIANKKEWASYALKRVPDREWERVEYARCPVHNYFESAPWTGEPGHHQFQNCCARMTTGTYIEPRFGFITSNEEPGEPRRQPARLFSTRPYFAGFRDHEGDEIAMPGLRVGAVSPGYMVVICEGFRGGGFSICSRCGAGFTSIPRNHKTPQGRPCNGQFLHTALGHRFVTDVLQIRFCVEMSADDPWLSHAVAAAVMEGAATAIEVPSSDLSAVVTLGQIDSTEPTIVLYDNVPGGAGLVERLQEPDMMKACLTAAYDRVANCTGCAEEASCYACIRNYRNQYVHENLQRGTAVEYLKRVLAYWE